MWVAGRKGVLAVAAIVTTAWFGGLVTSCATADPDTCERNSDCSVGYCSNGACKQDCVDASRDCAPGQTCNENSQCVDGVGGAAGSAGGEGGTSAAGTMQVAGNGGASAGGAAGTSGAAGAGVGGAKGGAAGSEPEGGAGAGGAAAGGSNAGAGGASAGGSGTAGDGGSGAAAGSEATGGGGASAGSGASGAGTGGVSPFGGGGSSGAGGAAATGGGGSSAAGTGHELDACVDDGDCAAPLLCRADYVNGPLRCERTCSSSIDCFGGRRCESLGGTNVCVGGDVGRECTDANTCNFACLTSQHYCTSRCNTGADCPSGYGCEGVGTPATSVCVKAEAPCDVDASACIAAAACDMTLVVSSCTLACNSAADCPQRAAGLPAWTCDGLCRRPSDVFGPLPGGSSPTQWACNGQGTVVNLCNDDLHLDLDTGTSPNPPVVSCSATTTTSGAAGDTCIDSCTFDGGCAFGFACVSLGSLGSSRIGLCLPFGTTWTGNACTANSDCEFGYCTSAGVCSRDCSADGLCPTGTTCTPGDGPEIEGKPFARCL